jgi:hypothetical protein
MGASPIGPCPKCGGRMIAGFAKVKDGNGGHAAASWVEGIPERSIWTGLKLRGRKELPITAHRCPRCFYLEFFAPGG